MLYFTVKTEEPKKLSLVKMESYVAVHLHSTLQKLWSRGPTDSCWSYAELSLGEQTAASMYIFPWSHCALGSAFEIIKT